MCRAGLDPDSEEVGELCLEAEQVGGRRGQVGEACRLVPRLPKPDGRCRQNETLQRPGREQAAGREEGRSRKRDREQGETRVELREAASAPAARLADQ